MMMKKLYEDICRSFFILVLIAAGTTIFPFAVNGSDNSGTALAGVSIVDLWKKMFTSSLVPMGTAGASYSDEASANLKITVRDSVTGQRIRGRITFVQGYVPATTLLTDAEGVGTYRLVAGFNDLEIVAPGYKTLKTHFEVGQAVLNITVWLDPQEIPIEMRPEIVESNLRNGSTLIHGHIIDNESGTPLENARVSLENARVDAISDRSGYFRMYVPPPPVDPAGDLPGTDDLVVELDGKVIYRRNNTMLPDGAVHFIIDIDRGGSVAVDGTHKLRLSAGELKNIQTAPPESAETNLDIDRKGVRNETVQPASVTVPSSIRVGSNCPSGRFSCTTFAVYALDTYVRLGLDDEWISSWNANSLKAGAIAFRSYGVYHVFNPLTANYDICNTTSCQVIDPADSAASTDNATAQTTGSIVVTSTGNRPFFAEYSAENNLGGCPDGFTGNNGSWPCLSDPVDAGRPFFGHGRGMCQWGSQRWSINQGKDFVWIVNHYYNGNGNPSGLRAGYLQMSPGTQLPPPTLAAPGVTTAPGTTVTSLTPTFEWQAVNGADGYSLYISKLNGSTYDLIFNSETIAGQPLTGTSYTLPAGFLQTNSQYRWNMSSYNIAGYGTANVFRNYFFVSLPVSVSGRVTTPTGLGLRNATVALTDSQGVRQTATTSSFGFYAFDSVRTGETYTITVSSKRYRFTPRIMQFTAGVGNLDFQGLE